MRRRDKPYQGSLTGGASVAHSARIDELDLAVPRASQAGAGRSVGQAGNPATMKPRKSMKCLRDHNAEQRNEARLDSSGWPARTNLT